MGLDNWAMALSGMQKSPTPHRILPTNWQSISAGDGPYHSPKNRWHALGMGEAIWVGRLGDGTTTNKSYTLPK
jgi:hypothetical protein